MTNRGENTNTERPPRAPFKTIKQAVRCEDEAIKGSRFITLLAPIDSAQSAQQVIQDYQLEIPNMRHYCSAFTLHQQGRAVECHFSDDGEPAGSAGKPMLAQLSGHSLENVIAVVARHFGGVKLGVGGLVRAYSAAVAYAINQAEIITIQPKTTIHFRFDYPQTAVVETVLAHHDLSPSAVDYAEQVTMQLTVIDQAVLRIKQDLIERSGDKIEFITPEQ